MDLVALGPQPAGDALVAPAAVAPAVDEDEGRHAPQPSTVIACFGHTRAAAWTFARSSSGGSSSRT